MKVTSVQLMANAGIFSSVLLVPLILYDMGMSTSYVGVVVAAYAFSVLVSSWYFGRLSDVKGRRMFLQGGMLLSAAVAALQLLARTPESMLFARIAMGVCVGIFPAALTAYAYESGNKIGRLLGFGSLGWGIGTTMAGLLADYWGDRYIAFTLSSIFFFVAFLITLTLPFPKEVHLKVPLFPVAVIKRNLPVYSAMLVRHTGANLVWVIYPIFLSKEIGAADWVIGVIYAVNSIAQFIVMNMLDGYRGQVLVPAGIAMTAVTFFLFAISTELWEVIAIQVVLGISWALVFVGSNTLILESGAEHSTGTGLLQSVMTLSQIIGALVGGVIAAAFGMRMTMVLAMVISILAMALYYGMERRHNGTGKPTPKSHPA